MSNRDLARKLIKMINEQVLINEKRDLVWRAQEKLGDIYRELSGIDHNPFRIEAVKKIREAIELLGNVHGNLLYDEDIMEEWLDELP